MLWLFHLAVLIVCCRAQPSVHTQPKVNVMEGSAALLPCTFTLGPGDRLQSINVDWENPNSTVIFYHYHHNFSVSTQKSVVFVGNISQNNASILLRDVRLMDEGNYLCLVRVGMNWIKNGTELRVRARGRMLEVPLSPPPPPLSPAPPPLSPAPLWPAVAGGLVLVTVLALSLWRLQRARQQHTTHREDQRSVAVETCQDPKLESPGRDKDTDCYVTLPRNHLPKDPPPLSCSATEGIYLTMHTVQCVDGPRSERGRKGIPEEWCALETHPREHEPQPPSSTDKAPLAQPPWEDV
ncbi:uncharacterized protein LOC131708071 [Acipenser ruthenus]|uniref:uncharacterized protein LOC131708071 n=1 Tax=Acipenser ruthenus TaxID=7906 RepID=UPI002741F1E7|nr:uncharacterized protein LOC131708071 [Acipenser ruthenus]